LSNAEFAGQHYSGAAYEFETTRLTELCPVEFAMTKRMLDRWIPHGSVVAEIGVGAGHYSEHLAAQVAAVSRVSATDLHPMASASFDAVLLLGPLYHLCQPSDRQRAVDEAARLLKSHGLLYAAGINRLPYFRDLFRESPQLAAERRQFHKQFLEDGNVDPDHAPPLGFGHLSTAGEFEALFAGLFDRLILMGVESFTAPWQPILLDLEPDQVEAWLDLVEQTGVTAEGWGASDHFLFVGRKAD